MPADEELRKVRDLSAAPLLVEPFSAADLPAVKKYADGVVVAGHSMQNFRLLTAVGGVGLPVVVHRGGHCTIDEWLSAVDYIRAEGTENVVLSEAGSRRRGAERSQLDLALAREVRDRAGLPVMVDVSDAPWLSGAAVAAGADGIWLSDDALPSDVDAARTAVTMLTPLVRHNPGGSVAACREAIDSVDAVLASLLEYRVALVSEIQRHKPVSGHAGRDPDREAEIVRAMAPHAPSLSREQLARIMDSVITAGLDATESATEHPDWRI